MLAARPCARRSFPSNFICGAVPEVDLATGHVHHLSPSKQAPLTDCVAWCMAADSQQGSTAKEIQNSIARNIEEGPQMTHIANVYPGYPVTGALQQQLTTVCFFCCLSEIEAIHSSFLCFNAEHYAQGYFMTCLAWLTAANQTSTHFERQHLPVLHPHRLLLRIWAKQCL